MQTDIQDKIIIEGVHYKQVSRKTDKKQKLLFTQEGYDLLKERYYISNEIKNGFGEAYISIVEKTNLSDHKISHLLAKHVNYPQKTVYNFIRSAFCDSKKHSKARLLEYTEAFKKLIKDIKKGFMDE